MPDDTAENIYALVVICGQGDEPGRLLEQIGEMTFSNVGLICAVSSVRAGDVFSKAQSLGCTHVIAIYSGVGADIDSIKVAMAASDREPTSLVVMHCAFPTSGSFLRISNLLLRLASGRRVRRNDLPRVYPALVMKTIDPSGTRRFSELEILVRTIWAGCPLVTLDTSALPNAHAGSQLHSLPMSQMWQELWMHVRLMARILSGLPNPRYAAAVVSPVARQSFWRMFWRWLNPFDAWRELRQGGAGRNEMAVGLAVGAFIGNMPAWGFHTVFSLYVARRLHLNPLAVMTGSHASAPPMGPVLVASAMWIGHVILHGSPPKWENITPFHGKFMANALPLLLDWTLGALIVGTALSIIVYVAANFLFRFVEKPKTDAGSAGVAS